MMRDLQAPQMNGIAASNKYRHKKLRLRAQAMTELATFGSVLLFMLGVLVSYGLSFRYQHSLRHKAYNEAERIAKTSDYSGTGYGANVLVIRDKPVISVTDPYAASGLTEYRATASIVNSQMLIGDVVFDRNNEECNVTRMTYDMESNVPHAGDGETVQRTFTTSAFRRLPETGKLTDTEYAGNRKILVKIECNDGACDTDGDKIKDTPGFWYWKELNLDGEFEEETGAAEGYSYGQSRPVVYLDRDLDAVFLQYDLDNDGEVDTINSVNIYPITGDPRDKNKEKTLVKLYVGDVTERHDEYYGYIWALKLLDSQTGELDLTYDTQDYAEGTKPTQGLLPYIKSETQTPNLQINKEETGYAIVTENTANRIDLIHRDIRVNPNYWDGPENVEDGAASKRDDVVYGEQWYIEEQTTEVQDRRWDWHAPWDIKTYDWPDVKDEDYSWYDEQ